jgi:hypothetical protein
MVMTGMKEKSCGPVDVEEEVENWMNRKGQFEYNPESC